MASLFPLKIGSNYLTESKTTTSSPGMIPAMYKTNYLPHPNKKKVDRVLNLLLTNLRYLSLWRPSPTAPDVTTITSYPRELKSLICMQNSLL
jgi:hypothetical protein